MTMNQELVEYQDFLSRQPQDAPQSVSDMKDQLLGFLSPYGFHSPYATWVEVDERQQILRIPWLDQFWTRAGCVFMTFDEAVTGRFMNVRLRISACLREMERRGDTFLFCRPDAGADLRKRLIRLGGSVE